MIEGFQRILMIQMSLVFDTPSNYAKPRVALPVKEKELFSAFCFYPLIIFLVIHKPCRAS
jgi:hypothetical protein